MPTIKMTTRTLESIKPVSGKQIDYFDANTSGLHLRVSPKGTKTWAYFYRAQTRNGSKQRRFTLGRFPALSLADARIQAFEQYRNIQVNGADPAFEKAKVVQIVTMNDMAAAYILRHAKPNKKSWKEDERNLRKNVLPVIGKLHPRDVQRQHIETILDRIADRGATTMQNRVFALLSGMFNWGVGVYIDVPPTYGMKKRIKEKSRERCLTPEEITKIWKALETAEIGKSGRRLYASEPVGIILKLLLVTAQRSSEVSQARVSEFDLKNKVWMIPAERVKNGRSHRVPLSNLAISLVQRAIELSDGSDFLFPSPTTTPKRRAGETAVIPTACNNALRKIVEKENLENITPHDFRETVATGMMLLGLPEQHVAAVLNHTRSSVTAKHYARHSFENEKRAALTAWADHLSELLGLDFNIR